MFKFSYINESKVAGLFILSGFVFYLFLFIYFGLNRRAENSTFNIPITTHHDLIAKTRFNKTKQNKKKSIGSHHHGHYFV